MTDFIDRVKALRDRTELQNGANIWVHEVVGHPHLVSAAIWAYLPCTTTGRVGPQQGRQWLLDWKMTDNQIFNTFLLAWLTFVEHEAREVFKVDGEALYEPKH